MQETGKILSRFSFTFHHLSIMGIYNHMQTSVADYMKMGLSGSCESFSQCLPLIHTPIVRHSLELSQWIGQHMGKLRGPYFPAMYRNSIVISLIHTHLLPTVKLRGNFPFPHLFIRITVSFSTIFLCKGFCISFFLKSKVMPDYHYSILAILIPNQNFPPLVESDIF